MELADVAGPPTEIRRMAAKSEAAPAGAPAEPQAKAMTTKSGRRVRQLAPTDAPAAAAARPSSEIASPGSSAAEKKRSQTQAVEKRKFQAELPAPPVAGDRKPARGRAKPRFNPEVATGDNAFSTFSLNVSDVAFRLTEAGLAAGRLPDPAGVRAEEFINAMDYHDPAPASGERLAFAWEQARDPFQHNRDLIRLSVQTGAIGRSKEQQLNLVALLDNSGSMERSDRVEIVRRALGALARKLTPRDRISVVAFARTPRLLIDGAPGGDPAALLKRVAGLTPEGGTNLDAALDLAYEIASRHFQKEGVNRVILLTDGAANLGRVDPEALKHKAEAQRRRGIALDCFGVGWDGYNDALLEALTRNADGRYGFLNDPLDAEGDFADQLAGALRVAARDVKAQVEFNPARVLSWRQIGYEKRQLKKEDFRDNSVDAAEIGAAETGTAVYSVQLDPRGIGPLGVARVRFLNPDTGRYEERSWTLFHRASAPALADSPPAMRVAGCAAKFAGWLAGNPHDRGASLAELRVCLAGTDTAFARDPMPARLLRMIQQAQLIGGSGDS